MRTQIEFYVTFEVFFFLAWLSSSSCSFDGLVWYYSHVFSDSSLVACLLLHSWFMLPSSSLRKFLLVKLGGLSFFFFVVVFFRCFMSLSWLMNVFFFFFFFNFHDCFDPNVTIDWLDIRRLKFLVE